MENLIIAYRQVPQERLAEYDRTWLALRDAARSGGLRAWRYRALDAADQFVEFLEGSAVERHAALTVETARGRLDALAPASSDRTWRDAPATGPSAPTPGDRAALLALLRERSLRRGDFVLASGARSHYYIDARPTTMSAAGQKLIGRLGLAEIDARGWKASGVGGLTLGADPVAYAIAHASALAGRSLDAFTVRKQPKAHGTGRRVEGNLPAGGDVVIVEDVMTTGGSALDAARAATGEGARVLGVLAVVDREAGGPERLTTDGFETASLFTATELLAG